MQRRFASSWNHEYMCTLNAAENAQSIESECLRLISHGFLHTIGFSWKNGRQVDPFKQKLPEAKPISKKLKDQFLTYIEPVKTQLNCLSFEENKEDVILALN